MQNAFYPNLSHLQHNTLNSQLHKLTQIYDQYLLQLSHNQFQITQHLIMNQAKLSDALERQRNSSDSGTSSPPIFQNSKKSSSESDPSCKPIRANCKQLVEENGKKFDQSPKVVLESRLRAKKKMRYDFAFEDENQKETKKSETKNIIKNFIKSTFTFFRKNKPYRQQLLQKFGLEELYFLEQLEKLNNKINTIQQLRSLWTEHDHHEVFRVLCQHFLQKYYYRHIFNSRIVNHAIHLKYRQKLLDSLENPHQFTILKQF